MFVATSPSKTVSAVLSDVSVEGMHGRVELRFGDVGGGKARLKDLYQTSPFRVLFPTLPADELTSAVLVTTSGGLVGGDRLDVGVTVDTGAAVQVMGQAAEKVYRSKGPDTHFNADLNVGGGGYLEWLPQETIVFDQSRLRRTTSVDVARGGEFCGAEMLVFGRTAMGERVNTGLIRDVWDVRQDGKRVWADALHLDGDIAAKLDHPAGFDGARAVATFVHVGPLAVERLEWARTLLGEGDEGLRNGATVVNGVLVVRWLADDAQRMRAAFGDFWAAFRAHTRNLPGKMPRLWHV
ncbi:urease accessory protein UreD [Magnetovibrio sp.]|uniref:urease accessory protein UreD n=1 Tax=Magnetovibrio sp. TaxID=2024836 RepID=UPI002F94367C